MLKFIHLKVGEKMIHESLKKDFSEIADMEGMEQFRNKTFLITGSTGLIGSLLIKFFIYLNRTQNLGIKIYGTVRNLDKAKSYFAEYDCDSINFVLIDFLDDKKIETFEIKGDIDYIIHTAAVTTSQQMVKTPVETLLGAIQGTKCMLKLAKEKRVKKIIYLSSMEAYGIVGKSEKVKENELGYLDLDNIRSCYPEGKRACECLCKGYHAEYGVPTIQIRLAQTFGAGIHYEENRVFAQFARSAMKKSPIVLHTAGKSEGNYVYTSDAVQAILFLLLHGIEGETYNITNKNNHMTIYDMAKLVAKTIGGDICEVVVDIPENAEKLGYAPDTKLYMSSRKINKLGWYAKVDLNEAYVRLCAYLKECEGETLC